jgi:hypothetical protein
MPEGNNDEMRRGITTNKGDRLGEILSMLSSLHDQTKVVSERLGKISIRITGHNPGDNVKCQEEKPEKPLGFIGLAAKITTDIQEEQNTISQILIELER